MNIHLLYRDRDYDSGQNLPVHTADLTQDLGLDVLFDAMAGGDSFLREVARKVVLQSLDEPEAIVYRQQVLRDCLAQPAIARELYAVAVEAIAQERKVFYSFLRSPEIVLGRAIDLIEIFIDLLQRLRKVADAHVTHVSSEGFARFFAMLRQELDDVYLQGVRHCLEELRFRRGVLISARLGAGNKGVDYVLRKPGQARRGWKQFLPFAADAGLTLAIADRDEAGAQALAELRARGLNDVANVLAQSADHILGFFACLRAELGFYLACLNLWQQLASKGEPLCFPVPFPGDQVVLQACGLYDPCLSLRMDGRVVGNDLSADGKALVMITGANRGGKSTFLRSLGLAQLMMQCGMFVAAEQFRARVRTGLFTHFKREEDAALESGKFDEELARMSAIADLLRPGCLVLFNESFAATNEREGADIASGIIQALLDTGIAVCFVTHAYELAHRWYSAGRSDALFLRAERQSDGTRTFKLREAGPLPTSYGVDLFRAIFADVAGPEEGQQGETALAR